MITPEPVAARAANTRAEGVSRRQFVASALAVAGAMSTAATHAQGLTGLAYEVGPWSGPLAHLALLDTAGKSWRPADLTGRAVLINFWASWCEPCRAEMPSLQQLADLYGADKLLVLAVNFKEPPARALQFAKTTGVTLPMLLDLDGKLARQWGVKVFPTTLLISASGKPRQRVTGEVDWTGQDAEKLVAGLQRP